MVTATDSHYWLDAGTELLTQSGLPKANFGVHRFCTGWFGVDDRVPGTSENDALAIQICTIGNAEGMNTAESFAKHSGSTAAPSVVSDISASGTFTVYAGSSSP
jgi:hypothetical protein